MIIETTEVAQQIAAIRARWAAELAEREALTRQENEQYHQEALAELAKTLPSWMLEYIGEVWSPTSENDWRFHLSLPGCAPITVNMYGNGTVTHLLVREPQGVVYTDGKWQVLSVVHTIYAGNLDEAIDLAASFGESRHEMQTEADRRNSEGLKPPPPALTALELAHKALEEAGNAYCNGADDAAAAAALAVARQLALLNETLMKTGR